MPVSSSKSDLKRFLDAKTKPSRLIGDIERHLMARPVGDRSTTVLHPSEIIKRDFCRRSAYFLLLFDLGPTTCPNCGNDTMEYNEVTLVDNDLRIAGHTDGWIKGIGDDTLIEIKSIGPGTIRSEAPNLFMDNEGDFMKAWKNVRRPFPSHIMQGQVYLELMQRMGHDVNEIVFIYELKADQDYKEFSIKRDFELVRHIFDNAKLIVDAVEAGLVPDCNNNPGGTCKQCAPYKED